MLVTHKCEVAYFSKVKGSVSVKKEDSLFDWQFLKRFSARPVFFLLCGSFIAGVIIGAVAVKSFGLLQNQTVMPLFFSGLPALGSGFLSCFSGILLNVLIGLIIIFLLGVTAFGAFSIPVFILYRGVSVAVSVLFLLTQGETFKLGRAALCFTPAAVATSLLLILFATRALVFSGGLAKAGFSRRQETLDFQLYFKDFMYFLCFSVAVSVTGGLLGTLYELF